MKRKLLMLVSLAVILCAFFAISVMAEGAPAVSDTYYLVNSEESPAYAELTAQGQKVVCYADIVGDTTRTH